jgi:very-short-patch-repair endonuclease
MDDRSHLQHGRLSRLHADCGGRGLWRVAVEYDGVDWHSDPDAMKRDRRRCAAVEDVGWVVISIVFEDVRYRAWEVVMLERPERARSARS